MKLLSTILKKIEAGSEDAIREQLDSAIGMWAADHGSAHTIVAVSEDSVAFADADGDFYVARYAIQEGVVALSKVRRLLNVVEQTTNVDHLDEVAAKVIKAISENHEADVGPIIHDILEMKQDAMRIAGMTQIENPADRRKQMAEQANQARFGVAQGAKKTAKRDAFLASQDVREALTAGKVPETVREAVQQLPAAAVNLLATLIAERQAPIAEGFTDDAGVPTVIQKKGAQYVSATAAQPIEEGEDMLGQDEETRRSILEAVKTGKKVEVHIYDAPAAKEAKGKFHAKPRSTGKGHSVRYKGKSYRLHGGDKGKGKIYLQDRAYHGVSNRKNAIEKREAGVNEEDQKWNGKDLGTPLKAKRNEKLIQGGQGKPTEKADVSEAGQKFAVVDCGGGKWQVQKTGEDGVMSIAGDYDTAEGAASAMAKMQDKKTVKEGVIVANLKALTERFDTKDFFYRTGVAWASFRSEGIGQAAVEVLEAQGTPQDVLNACPLLALCNETAIYEMLAPHLDAFDPASIRAYAKQVFEAGQTEDSKTARIALLDALTDATLKETILASGTIAEHFDHLFLEGDGFDFGAAEDMGNDDLGDDQDTKGMQDPKDELAGDDAQDDIDGDFDDHPVQFEMGSTEARDLFRKILDVIGSEIEDDEDFTDLKARVDDENQDLQPNDVTMALHVIGDYFAAVGKDSEDQEEAAEDKSNGDETLDDMDGEHNKPSDDTEGDAGNSGNGDGLGDLDDLGT